MRFNMPIKSWVKGLYTLGFSTTKLSQTKLQKFELLLGVANLIPHPTVKMLSRSAVSGLALYNKYQKLKQLKARNFK